MLVPLHGNLDKRPRPLDRDVTAIGRARGSDLCLDATEISTLHCLVYRTPATRTANINTSFHITQKWGAQLSTIYDLARNRFASNQVQLSRELHDWRANFAYTAAGNGNSLFSFFISLKAQPDVSLPYNRATTRATR